MKKVEIILPLFPGVYGTIFEAYEDMLIDYINEIRFENNLDVINSNSISFNYKGYMQDVAKLCVKFMSNELSPKFLNSIEFVKVCSPREYNFRNDIILVNVSISRKNEREITKYISENKNEFAEYISDNFTSCDGFMSHTPNHVEAWENPADFTEPQILGFFEFYCECEGITQHDMFEYCSEIKIECIDLDFETTKKECSHCGEYPAYTGVYSEYTRMCDNMKKYYPGYNLTNFKPFSEWFETSQYCDKCKHFEQ